MAILSLLWDDSEKVWFGLLCSAVLASGLLAAAHAAASGSQSFVRALFSLFHLHHVFNAVHCLRVGRKTDEYIGGRLFQAVLEAGPGAVLQLYIMLVRDDYSHIRVASVLVSVMAVASTLGMDTAPVDATRREVVRGGDLPLLRAHAPHYTHCHTHTATHTLPHTATHTLTH